MILQRNKMFRALKLSNMENFRALKTSNLAIKFKGQRKDKSGEI